MRRAFQLTLFTSAFLLFLVQPLVARLLLPRFGGAPAIWNTCQAFFQATLLLGYAYAHLLATRAPRRAQVLVHGVVLASAALVLPLALPRAAPGGAPVLALLALLAGRVALPFFAVSTTAPLLQRWFAATDDPDARDPYFLYAASNAGSFAGLLAYPVIVEPRLRLASQGAAWSLGYAALGALVLSCGGLSLRRASASREEAHDASPGWRRRARWVLLAFVPSSLCLSVTTYLTTDVAAVPLLWVIPLGVYLLTFVGAFARPWGPWLDRGAAPLVVPAAVVAAVPLAEPLLLVNGAHLLAFAATALALHAELARDRPGPARLTEFYLLASLGGVLGGALNAFVAPLVFTSVAEYPLVLVGAAFLFRGGARGVRPRDLIVPAAATALGVALARLLPRAPHVEAYACLVPAAAALATTRPGSRAVAIAGVFLVTLTGPVRPAVLHEERSFFGVHRVLLLEERGERWNVLRHGSTIHGYERQGPGGGREPLTYYHPAGPAGQLLGAKPRRRVGVVGLGAGSLAAYVSSGQSLAFFEIDPAVQRIAEGPHFGFLRAARERGANVTVTLGDARLTLEEAPRGAFDLLLVDAFSSDAIPVHLVTREAVALYVARLAPGGTLGFHVSSRYVRLEPVLEAIARAEGLVGAARFDERLEGAKKPSHWVALARTREDLGRIGHDPRWRPLQGDGRSAWTDDFADVIGAFDFSR